MDKAKRDWSGTWDGSAEALLDAAAAAIAACELPIAPGRIELQWRHQESAPMGLKAARDKLLMAPPPERVLLQLAPAITGERPSAVEDALQTMHLMIDAVRDGYLTVRGSATDATALRQAFDGALTVLNPAPLTLCETCGRPATMLRETERGID